MTHGWLYRLLMKLAHRYDWHYAPVRGPISPDWTYQRWCQWCGMRDNYKYDPRKPPPSPLIVKVNRIMTTQPFDVGED